MILNSCLQFLNISENREHVSIESEGTSIFRIFRFGFLGIQSSRSHLVHLPPLPETALRSLIEIVKSERGNLILLFQGILS